MLPKNEENIDLPYPWRDSEYLAPALDDAELWSDIVSVLDAEERKPLKKALARQTMTRRLAINDAPAFGVAIVEYLRSVRSRRLASSNLTKFYKRAGSGKIFSFGQILGEYLKIWLSSSQTPLSLLAPAMVNDSLEPNVVDSRLTATRFREHLDELYAPEALLSFALLACAESLTRGGCPDYARALLENNPDYSSLLINEVTAPCVTDVRDVADVRDVTNHVEAPPPAQTSEDRSQVLGPQLAISKAALAEPKSQRSEPLQELASELLEGAEPANIGSAAIEIVSPSPSELREIAREAEVKAKADRDDHKYDDVLNRARSLEIPPLLESALRARDQGREIIEIDECLDRAAVLVGSIQDDATCLGITPFWPAAGGESMIDYVDNDLGILELEIADRLTRQRCADVATSKLLDRVSRQASGRTETAPKFSVPECTDILLVFAGERALSQGTQAIYEHRQDPILLSGITALIIHSSVEEAVAWIRLLPFDLRQQALRGLSLPHSTLLQQQDMIASDVSYALLARAISQGEFAALRNPLTVALYRNPPILQEQTRELIKICLGALGDDFPVASVLRGELADGGSGGERNGPVDAQAIIRDQLLESIDQLPGMTGLFHRLRRVAQKNFLQPLADAVKGSDAESAHLSWSDQGDLDAKVEVCIRELGSSTLVRRNLNSTHVAQTRRYLESFEKDLNTWLEGASLGSAKTRDALSAAWTAAVEVEPELLSALMAGTLATTKPEDSSGSSLRLLVESVEAPWYTTTVHGLEVNPALLRPTWVRTWVRAAQGLPTTIPSLLWEVIEEHIVGQKGLRNAISTMLESGHIRAAVDGAGDDEYCAQLVKRAATQRRNVVLERFKGPWRRAEAIMNSAAEAEDDEIADEIADIEAEFDAFDYAAAELHLEELDDLLIEHKLHKDPARRAHLSFLREAGGDVDVRAETSFLAQQVEEIRANNLHRRHHIGALKCASEMVDERHREPMDRLRIDLDRPSRWPKNEKSADAIAMAITRVFTFIRNQREAYRSYHDCDLDLIEFEDELVGLVKRVLPLGRQPHDLIKLGDAIRNYAPLEYLVAQVAPYLARRRDDIVLGEQGRHAYISAEYGRAAKLFHAIENPELGGKRLETLARLMDQLANTVPLDIQWNDVQQRIESIRPLAEDEQGLDQLSEIAMTINSTLTPTSRSQLLETLAFRARPELPELSRAILFVLTHQLKIAAAKPPSEALALVVPLPEQVFRVWAHWRLGLSYNSVPEGNSSVWRFTKDVWDSDGRGNRMRIPAAGECFPTFRCFALFAQVKATLEGQGIEPSIDHFVAALRTLRLRNDGAHGLARPTLPQLTRYFDLIQRWIEQVYEVCPVGDRHALRQEIRVLLNPLPLPTCGR